MHKPDAERATELAGPPTSPVPVPAALRIALDSHDLGSSRIRPVWKNGVGGVTFSIASGNEGRSIDFYAKWNPVGAGESLTDEAERLHWIHGRHPVPVVVDLISDGGEEVLITHALPGESAVAERWKQDPRTALRALGTGLRRLHEVSLGGCPFMWGVEDRIRSDDLPTDVIEPPPPIDKLVLCQGDPCAPNTLLADDGSFLAHVDLARIGAADRWADLAVMSLSLEWNYRGHDESIFWDAYGIEPDPLRITYYRRLWNAA